MHIRSTRRRFIQIPHFTIDKKHVDLHHSNNDYLPSGIYRCDIATNAVHDNNDISVRDSVYVGLYANGGKSCICVA